MENLTMAQFRDFMVVVGVILAAVVLIGNASRTWKEGLKPTRDLAQWRRDVDKKLDYDNKRLERMEEGNKVICRGILALLSHEVNGNSTDKLKSSQQEITDYLIDR